MVDVITPDGVAVSVKDAVADVALRGNAEFCGRLVTVLIEAGVLDANHLRRILPATYEVRE